MAYKRRPVLVLWENMTDVAVGAVTKAAPSPPDKPRR